MTTTKGGLNVRHQATKFSNDPEIFSLATEVGIARAVLEDLLEKYVEHGEQGKEGIPIPVLDQMSNYMSLIAKSLATYQDLINKRQYVITVGQLEYYLRGILETLDRLIEDPNLRRRIQHELSMRAIPAPEQIIEAKTS